MTATHSQQAQTILDFPESRFPIEVRPHIEKIRTLFYSATRNQWNPRVDIDWQALDLREFTEEQLFCARQYWSRRAYSEYGAISESPALSIRFCQDNCPLDLPLFFSIRTQEEARHAEACYLMAEHLGGYIEQPEVQFQGAVATHGVRKMAFDPETSLDALIGALVCGAEEIAFDVFRHLVDITRNPVARSVLSSIKQDEVRHCAFGWMYLGYRIKEMSREQLNGVESAVINMIEQVELNGYHSAWLAPDNSAAKAEVEADRITWEAGLGATVEELEKPVFVASVQRIRRQMGQWDIILPEFHHPKIGTF